MRLQSRALGLVPARLQPGAEVGDLLGHAVERFLQPRHAELLEPLARLHRRDHLDAGTEDLRVGLIPHGVVAVEVAVDDVPDGQLGDLGADLPDERLRGRGVGVGVHDQDVVAIDDHRRVAVEHGGGPGDRAVDPVGDLLEVEEPGRGGTGRGSLAIIGLRPDQSLPRQAARRRDQPGDLQSAEGLAAGEARGFAAVMASLARANGPAGQDGDGSGPDDDCGNAPGTCRPSESERDESRSWFCVTGKSITGRCTRDNHERKENISRFRSVLMRGRGIG